MLLRGTEDLPWSQRTIATAVVPLVPLRVALRGALRGALQADPQGVGEGLRDVGPK